MKRSTATLAMSACALLVGFAGTASAQIARSKPISIVTKENPAEPGSFTLNFTDLGMVASSNVISTDYELRVDLVKRTASFVSYLQHVQPLVLPGGISTGNMTIEIVPGSSTGTYNPFTRVFTTSEMYAIHFEGDLSAFGLTSPVHLPSSSSGQLAVDITAGGAVDMDWSGVGQLANPFNPSEQLNFSYTCTTKAVFKRTAERSVGLERIPSVGSLQLGEKTERSLLKKLDLSLARIQGGNDRAAVNTLHAFIDQVDRLSGTEIEEADATRLIDGALETIDLIHAGGLSGSTRQAK